MKLPKLEVLVTKDGLPHIIAFTPDWTEAAAAEIIRRAEAYNPWIPVSEKLPKNGNQVWVWYEGTNYTYVAYYCGGYKLWHFFDICGGYKKADNPPTHWKPIILPEQTND